MKKNSITKLSARDRKKLSIRRHLSGTDERPRISVFRSSKHIYAQIISDDSGKTIVSASTLDEEVLKAIESVDAEGIYGDTKSTKSVRAARAVGIVLAQRAAAKEVSAVVFDRNGYIYQGRVQAVADGARQGGLNF